MKVKEKMEFSYSDFLIYLLWKVKNICIVMGVSWINLSVKRNGIRMPMGQKFRALGCTHWWDRKIWDVNTHWAWVCLVFFKSRGRIHYWPFIEEAAFSPSSLGEVSSDIPTLKSDPAFHLKPEVNAVLITIWPPDQKQNGSLEPLGRTFF